MKRIYTLVKAMSAMLLVIMFFASCKKSIATDTPSTEIIGNQVSFPLYTSDSASIGSIVFSKQSEGNAKVLISINKPTLNSAFFPYQPTLISSTLPTATLQPLNADGISETFPVISSNKSLIVSYDALMFMRDLKLVITDGNNNQVVVADAH